MTLLGFTFPPVAFHLIGPLTDPRVPLVQLALKGALAPLSTPDVTVTAGLPVVPVEQDSLALTAMTVDTGAPMLNGG